MSKQRAVIVQSAATTYTKHKRILMSFENPKLKGGPQS